MVPEIKIGEYQYHNFHTPGDLDYVKFKGVQSITYTIWTTRTLAGFPVDTILTLYDTNCMTLTQHDDNNWPTDLFSTITWHITATGTYFVRVEHWDPLAGGCGPEYWYTLAITTTSSSSSRPEGAAHLAPHLPMTWERSGIFLPVYWKDWDGLRRFRR